MQDTQLQIVKEAARLFREQGYSATSTRQIAASAGIRQPSLFHHFPSKQAIFEAVILHAAQPELEFIEAERLLKLPADVSLYRYSRFVFHNLSTNPSVIGSPLLFPELNREDFPRFWATYELIYGAFTELLRQGIAANLFWPFDVALTSHQLFSLVEAPLSMRRQTDIDADEAARLAAQLILRATLKDVSRLDAVVAAAD